MAKRVCVETGGMYRGLVRSVDASHMKEGGNDGRAGEGSARPSRGWSCSLAGFAGSLSLRQLRASFYWQRGCQVRAQAAVGFMCGG